MRYCNMAGFAYPHTIHFVVFCMLVLRYEHKKSSEDCAGDIQPLNMFLNIMFIYISQLRMDSNSNGFQLLCFSQMAFKIASHLNRFNSDERKTLQFWRMSVIKVIIRILTILHVNIYSIWVVVLVRYHIGWSSQWVDLANCFWICWLWFFIYRKV